MGLPVPYTLTHEHRFGILTPTKSKFLSQEVQEVYGLDLETCDIVVLSACETTVGELSAGDELVGLTRVFFFAGPPTVIASLWSVDDKAAKDLVVSFYSQWLKGLSKAEALEAAQAEVRKRYPSPFYWAAFVLSGDPGNKRVQSMSSIQATSSATQRVISGRGN